ncbi:hypothetical protein [Candidatus Poriferisodalis sp.]|uniref:hypothetical protein n=1 Tax=Candidatus Poriferisodalis sp. TaxID=3101277 RepID=UPI003D0D71FA
MLMAASAPPLLTELAILLVAGTLIAFLSSRFGVLPIVGFLIAGAVIGPGGAIQVGLTTGVVTAIVAAFGVDWRTSIFTCATTLS